MLQSILSLIIGASLIGFFGSGTRQPERPRIFVSPPKDLKYFSLGYNESVSDSLWLRVVQDIDYCEMSTPASGTSPLADASGISRQALSGFECHKGWVYSMLDAITTLTPKFRIVYSSGGSILSVVDNDTEGAKLIFEKGIANFPSDWQLQYRAAYHYLYSVKDEKRAADLLISAARAGGPKWLISLASHLYTKQGQAFLAKTVIEDVLSNDPNARYAKRLQERLTEAEAELAKAKAESPESK